MVSSKSSSLTAFCRAPFTSGIVRAGGHLAQTASSAVPLSPAEATKATKAFRSKDASTAGGTSDVLVACGGDN